MDVEKGDAPGDGEVLDVEAHMRTRAEAADRHSRDAESLASRARIAALRATQRSDDPTADEDREPERGS